MVSFARFAANIFSLSPPIGRTRPRRVISPVMAKSRLTGVPENAEAIAVAIVMPAEGPSLGMAPAGTWICKSCLLNMSGLRFNVFSRERT